MKLIQVFLMTAFLMFATAAVAGGGVPTKKPVERPVPEPTAMLVMAAGLATVAAVRRINKR